MNTSRMVRITSPKMSDVHNAAALVSFTSARSFTVVSLGVTGGGAAAPRGSARRWAVTVRCS
jgi:hypothetical protein